MSFRVHFYDLKSENLPFAADFHQILERILRTGRFVFGPELAQLEKELAEYLGVNQVWGVKSGTDGLFFAMKALGIGPGDEVITAPFTFSSTITAILRTGATPVLADIDPDTLCLSPERCRAVITAHTKAILLVHLFGNCSDVNQFLSLCQRENILLIEDAAQAIGSTYHEKKLGSFGTASAFSFYPTKNLGALGNGGAIAASSIQVDCETSARLDELQAAFLRLKLRHIDSGLTRRRAIARRYQSALNPLVKIVASAPDSRPNFHQFAIRTPHRDQLRTFLTRMGIETMVYYPQPIHRRSDFAALFGNLVLPEAERAAEETLCLPIRQNLTDDEQAFIISTIEKFFLTYD